MFNARYFARRYYPARYFVKTGAAGTVMTHIAVLVARSRTFALAARVRRWTI